MPSNLILYQWRFLHSAHQVKINSYQYMTCHELSTSYYVVGFDFWLQVSEICANKLLKNGDYFGAVNLFLACHQPEKAVDALLSGKLFK